MIDAIELALPKIAELGISTSALARLVGVSETEMRGILNRQRECSRERALRIDAVVTGLESLVRESSPLPIDLKKPETLRRILDRVESGNLKIVAIDLNEQ